MTRDIVVRIVLYGLLLVLLGGCTVPYEALQGCGAAVRYGANPELLAQLERSGLASRPRDRLLYLMEKGMLLHLQGAWRQSNAVLEEADRLADDLFTRSISAAALSLVVNDQVLDYVGEDYEVAYLSYVKALNYLALGDLDGARVECRRVDEKLNYLHDSYGGRSVFKESAMLRLLSGLIYEAKGEWNDAFIAYRKSLDAYLAARDTYRVPVPRLLWGRLLLAARRSGLADEYRQYAEEARQRGIVAEEAQTLVAVIVGSGLVPVRREGAVFVPAPQGGLLKLAWPRFEPAGCDSAPPWLSVDGMPLPEAEVVENVEAIARQSLEDKKGRTIGKLAARAASKQVLAAQVEQQFDSPLAGLIAQLAALFTENADLRGWTSLPGEVRIALQPVDPGEHVVSISKGEQEQNVTVQVGAGSLGFVIARVF